MIVTPQQKKDAKKILELFSNPDMANDSRPIGEIMKDQPRVFQVACDRFMRDTFCVGEVVSKAMHANSIEAEDAG